MLTRDRRDRIRAAVTWLNLSTPAGLALARLAADEPKRSSRRLWIATGYRLPIPAAPAFTLGSVVIVRDPRLARNPSLLAHEANHAGQYAWCGLALPVLYPLACAWSWLRTGDWWSRNAFEVRAGLASGGYPERPGRDWTRAAAAIRPGSRRREGARSETGSDSARADDEVA